VLRVLHAHLSVHPAAAIPRPGDGWGGGGGPLAAAARHAPRRVEL